VSAGALVLAWVAGLFSFGAAAIAVYAARKPDEGRELWRVFASTVVIAAAFLVPAGIHPWLFSFVVAAAAWRCAFELAATYGIRVGAASHAALAAAAATAVAWGAQGGTALLAVTAAVVTLTAPLYVRAFARPPTGWRAGIVAVAFPLLAAAHLSHLAHARDGFVWLCVLYATVETQDSMAFLCGRVFGRRRVLPRLSPGKTLEGAIAGACCGVSVGGAMAWGLLHLAPAAAVGVAALAMTAGFCGDLFTSALKRAAQVKDFPRLHRLHGGLLDIYDSTLFAAVPLSIITAFAVPPI
jgi:phosphatidate cytidylyltransferase